MEFFSVVLIHEGQPIATYMGEQPDLKHALLQLLFRADRAGKMSKEDNAKLRKHVDGADVIAPKGYGYVVMFAGQVKSF